MHRRLYHLLPPGCTGSYLRLRYIHCLSRRFLLLEAPAPSSCSSFTLRRPISFSSSTPLHPPFPPAAHPLAVPPYPLFQFTRLPPRRCPAPVTDHSRLGNSLFRLRFGRMVPSPTSTNKNIESPSLHGGYRLQNFLICKSKVLQWKLRMLR